MCGFYGVRRGNYFRGEPIRKTEEWGSLRMERLQVRMRSQERGGGNRVVEWIWKLCNMGFENGVVPEDWRYNVIVPWYKGKGERGQNAAIIEVLAC